MRHTLLRASPYLQLTEAIACNDVSIFIYFLYPILQFQPRKLILIKINNKNEVVLQLGK